MILFKGYITHEPQFACDSVDPPKNNATEWAALVKYNNMNCDCSYEQKVLIPLCIIIYKFFIQVFHNSHNDALCPLATYYMSDL